MKVAITMELRKWIKSPYWKISFLLGNIMCFLSFYYNVTAYHATLDLLSLKNIEDPLTRNAYPLFSNWVGGEGYSLGSILYFFAFPILVASFFGWSYLEEKNKGYMKLLMAKEGRKRYLLSKFCAVFLTGGIAMCLPLLINFWITAMFFPAFRPDIMNATITGVFPNSFLSIVYYTHPIGYVFLYLLLDFLIGGSLASFCLGVSSFLRWKWLAVLSPFCLCLVLNVLADFLFKTTNFPRIQISPFYFARGVETLVPTSGFVIVFFCLALLLFVYCTYYRKMRKCDVM